MSPEQLQGRPGRATDVYAASVVLWETLAAKRLFAATSEPEIVRKVMEGKVDPPSTYAAGIPPGLDAIALRGLHRDPQKRFETARDMAVALEQVFPVGWAGEDRPLGRDHLRRIPREDQRPDG